MLRENTPEAGRTESIDLRRDPRHAIDTPGVVRNGQHNRIGGAVIDISEHGCRIELYSGAAQPGQFVTIKLEQFESWSGVVRWCEGTQIGVEFSRGLHPAVVDHVARTHAVVSVN